jgi:hypothetical protein
MREEERDSRRVRVVGPTGGARGPGRARFGVNDLLSPKKAEANAENDEKGLGTVSGAGVCTGVPLSTRSYSKNGQILIRVFPQPNDSLTVRSSTILLNLISNLGRTAILEGCTGIVGEVGLESEIWFEFWASSSEEGAAAESMASLRMRGVRRAASGSKLIDVGRNNDAMITRCLWRVEVDMAGGWEV